MNEGQRQLLMQALRELNRHLDEIRRTLNRIDGRLRKREQVTVTEQENDK